MSATAAAVAVGVPQSTASDWCRLWGMDMRMGPAGGLVAPPGPPRADPFGGLTIGAGHGLRLGAAGRGVIASGLAHGRSLRAIAAELGVAPSTISREVRRHGPALAYDPGQAHQAAARARSRPKTRRLQAAGELRREVVARLRQRHSPQQISRRLRQDFPDRQDMSVCAETIYQALYLQGRGSLRAELDDVVALRSGRARRRPRSRLAAPRAANKPWLADAMITSRPADADDRAVPGHWEGDLIIGAGGRSAAITLVERSTRFLLIRRLPDEHDSTTVAQALTQMIQGLPAALKRTLTWDQGSEMARVADFRTATGMQVYFCDPHSPWQRATNENTNGLIRQYLPKGTDLSAPNDDYYQHIQDELNTRPRKTLNWATPTEALNTFLTNTPTTT